MELMTYQQKKDKVIALARSSAVLEEASVEKLINAITISPEHQLSHKLLDALTDFFEREKVMFTGLREKLVKLNDKPIEEVVEDMLVFLGEDCSASQSRKIKGLL